MSNERKLSTANITAESPTLEQNICEATDNVDKSGPEKNIKSVSNEVPQEQPSIEKQEKSSHFTEKSPVSKVGHSETSENVQSIQKKSPKVTTLEPSKEKTTSEPIKPSSTKQETRFSVEPNSEERKTSSKRSSKVSDRTSFGKRRLSRAVTEFLKQRKSLPSEQNTEPTETTEKVLQVIPKHLPATGRHSQCMFLRKDMLYSKAIEGLERQRKSLLQRPSSEDLQEKKLRFEDTSIRRDTDTISLSKGMKLQFKQCPKTCEKFLKVEDFSQTFVDDIIQDALSISHTIKIESSTKIVEGVEYRSDSEDSSSIASVGTYICVFDWPTIESFTIDIGTNKIIEYLSFWEFKENWKYCVNYLKCESDATCDFFRYEAIFGIPCKQYPVAQATASVYFTFEVSRVRPKQCLVDVYYSFEGRRLLHTPGQYKLQEAWLFHIIDAKISFFKKLTF